MHYFHTHFNVYPNPQGKVDARHNERSPNFANCKLRIAKYVDDELSSREDVQQQIRTDEPGAGSNIRQAEQHTQSHYEIKSVLKVGPLHPVVQSLAVAHPKHAIVGQVCDVPEQQQGSVVMVDQDVLVRFEKTPH